VITGFNTDVEHGGIVYHVQTEDKGLESPLILSLVYTGGTILASKRSPYEDLIESGFSDEALAERLKRQHRLICAAIHSGRIDDLKKMSGRGDAERTGPVRPTEPAVTVEEREYSANVETSTEVDLSTDEVETSAELVSSAEPFASSEVEVTPAQDRQLEAGELVEPAEADSDFESDEIDEIDEVATTQATISIDADIVLGIDEQQEMIWELLSKKKETEQLTKPQEAELEPEPSQAQPEPVFPSQPTAAYTVYDQRRVGEKVPEETTDGVVLKLLDEGEFYSGELRVLRVFVTDRRGDKEKALINFPVSIKILGTAFRPLMYAVKTERDGVASVATEIPHFTTGRAAVLIRVVGNDNTAELRRVIHPSTEVKH